jgi:hypothetical protein
MIRILAHIFMFLILTILTQIGGIAWLVSRLFKRSLLAFLALCLTASVATIWIAPQFGRVPLSCGSSSTLQVQSTLYCALNRHYVVPELKATLTDLATDMDTKIPGTITLVLDANFPFWTGFPLLPHLSHDDGRKADIAFYYKAETGYQPTATKSPIGYFAFEQGPTDCPKAWPSLRWDMGWLQPFWRDLFVDHRRTAAALQWLAQDPRVEKVFIEPHLRQTLGASHPKVRFQGCRAARHDDHIHFQI